MFTRVLLERSFVYARDRQKKIYKRNKRKELIASNDNILQSWWIFIVYSHPSAPNSWWSIGGLLLLSTSSLVPLGLFVCLSNRCVHTLLSSSGSIPLNHRACEPVGPADSRRFVADIWQNSNLMRSFKTEFSNVSASRIVYHRFSLPTVDSRCRSWPHNPLRCCRDVDSTSLNNWTMKPSRVTFAPSVNEVQITYVCFEWTGNGSLEEVKQWREFVSTFSGTIWERSQRWCSMDIYIYVLRVCEGFFLV